MAAALLGKCIGLLALALLFYGCGYAFRVREHPGQTASPSAEQPAHHRAACASIFGRCQEKATDTSSSRKWHGATATRLASAARKPPVELTSADDDDRGARPTSHRRTGRIADSLVLEKSSQLPSVGTLGWIDDDDDAEDEDDAIVEVEEDTAEEILSDEEETQPSGDEDDRDDDGEDDRDGGEESVEGGSEEDSEAEDGREEGDDGDEKEDERIARGKRGRETKPDSEDEDDDEDEEEEEEAEKDTGDSRVKGSKVSKVARLARKIAAGTEEDEDEGQSERVEDTRMKGESLEKGRKEGGAVSGKPEVPEENVEALDEDEDEQEDRGVEDDEADEDEDEEDEQAPPAPPLRKLEKVRHADKDKVIGRSAEAAGKLKLETKVPSKVEKKTEASVKKGAEAPKKSVETPTKPAEATKKVEPVKTTKSELESAKPKAAAKPEEKPRASMKPEASKTQTPVKPEKSRGQVTVKAEVSKTHVPAKQPEKATVKTTAQSAPVKNTAEVERSDKAETKVKTKTKTHVGAPFTLAQLNDAILRVPTFVPNFTAIEDTECQQHGKIFLRQLRGYKLWALQMLDASAKVPSGLLRGNVNQLGDFDECLGVMAHVKFNEKTIRVQGKYCLANIDLYASHPDMKLPVNMMQARALIRGSMRDTGHFVPKFTTVNWALCLPAACSAEDAQSVLRQALAEYNSTAGMRFTIDVDPNMCYVKQKPRSYSKETIGVLYFYATIVCLVVVATVRDYLIATGGGKGNYSERIIMSFSLRRTISALLKQGTSEADITCIHGIRALVTIALYVAHQMITISRLPFSNRIELTEISNTPLSSILRVSIVYTDTFLLLSGVLTAYNMSHEFLTRGEIRWFCRFIARYIRLTPPLLAVVFWYAFVMEHMGTGPQWNSIITPNAELCKSNAWTNLLYIQNFFPFQEMCAAHTHQLALDMQLSLLAPMLVFFLECRPIIGILVITFITLLSATLRYIATANNYLSVVIFHGMSVKHLYRTADLMYALPLHRATPYVFGVGLGVLLSYTGRNVRIHKVLVILGWLIAMALGSWSLFSPWHLARRDYVYNVEEATNYAVIGPVLWALALCWSIFACYANHGGLINKFLSSHWLIVFSRISYAVYLTQFAVFFYNAGTTRYSSEFQLHTAIDLFEVGTVMIVSIVVTLLFDLPVQEIKNVLMESTDVPSAEVVAEETSPARARTFPKDDEQAREKKAFEEDEVTSTGWDWQRDIVDGGTKLGNEDDIEDEEQVRVPILKKAVGRRKSFIAHESSEAEGIPSWDWIKEPNKRLARQDDDAHGERSRRSASGQRDYQASENDASDLSRTQQDREEAGKRGRRSLSRSRNVNRLSTWDGENEEENARRRRTEEQEGDEQEEEEMEEGEEEEDDPRRYRRSRSRGRSVIRESDDYRSWEFVGRERSSSRGPPDSKRLSGKSEEREAAQRQTRPPLSRAGDARRGFSSESEDEPSSQRKKIDKRHGPVAEPRISDEEDWESELRIRRRRYMEKLAMQQRDTLEDEEELTSLRRRSSAEGKIALLKDSSADVNMDSWTISLGSRVAQLGSSQERSEPEEETAARARRREYRERAPPSREDARDSEEDAIWDASRRRPSCASSSQLTSMEEDDEVASYNFILTKDSRRKSMQDLSKLSQDDSDLTEDSGWNLVRKGSTETPPRSPTTGLYKRESIIKSQASEEDPEYLLPERPKLVQQEREHPFKKAWQMQKSRSEEDGSAYVIKEAKESSDKTDARSREENESATERIPRGSGGERYEDTGAFADDESESMMLARGRSTDTEENTRSSSKSEEPDSASTSRSISGLELNKADPKFSDFEEDSLRSNWPSEDERLEVYKTGPRSKSEEAEWRWEREEDT